MSHSDDANLKVIISRIQQRRGLKQELPQPLRPGEIGFATDSRQVYIGADTSDAVSNTYNKQTVFETTQNAQDLTKSLANSQIIKFAFNEVPSQLKIKKNQRKILPKLVAKKMLPKDFDFMIKQGFTFPVNELFMFGKWHDFLSDRINSERNYYLDKKYCNQLIKQHKLRGNLGEPLFAILLFLIWCETYVH